jgi:hypothetical protein
VRKWRRSLHQYDDPAPKAAADEAGGQGEGTDVEEEGGAAPAPFDALPPLAAAGPRQPGAERPEPRGQQQQQRPASQSGAPNQEQQQQQRSAGRASSPGRHGQPPQRQGHKRDWQQSSADRPRDEQGRSDRRAVEPAGAQQRGPAGRSQGQAHGGRFDHDRLPQQSMEPRSGWGRQTRGDGGSRSESAGERRSWRSDEPDEPPGRGWRQAAGEPAAAAGRLTPSKRPKVRGSRARGEEVGLRRAHVSMAERGEEDMSRAVHSEDAQSAAACPGAWHLAGPSRAGEVRRHSSHAIDPALSATHFVQAEAGHGSSGGMQHRDSPAKRSRSGLEQVRIRGGGGDQGAGNANG